MPTLYKLVVWCSWYNRRGHKVGWMRLTKVRATSYNEASALAIASVKDGEYVAYSW